MDKDVLRILNEELDRLINEDDVNFDYNDRGFKTSGTSRDVRDFLDNITDKYGDLTIPEFIDLLIEKEEHGENIMNESYINEDVTYSDIEKICKKVVSKTKKGFTIHNFPIEKSGGTVGYEDLTFLPSYKKISGDSHATGTNNNVHDKITYKDTNLGVYIELLLEPIKRKRQDAVDRNSLWLTVRSISYDSDYISAKTLVINLKGLWDEYSKNSNYFKHEDHFNRYYGEQCEIFVDSIDEAVQDIIDCIQDYFDLANSKEWGKQHKDKYDSEYQAELDSIERLKQARRQARANRKSADTTVQQALTKTSVIKKLQSMKDLTPEKLAKILASIEE